MKLVPAFRQKQFKLFQKQNSICKDGQTLSINKKGNYIFAK